MSEQPNDNDTASEVGSVNTIVENGHFDEIQDQVEKHDEQPSVSAASQEEVPSSVEDNSEEDDDDSEDDDSEEEEDEEEDDDEPPLFKYQRLTQLPKPFFNKELITSSLIHESLYAFGSSSGLLHVTKPNFESIGTIRSRRSPILSIHTDGYTIIACSMDGTIMVSNTSNITSVIAYDLKVPTYCVVLNGQYKDTKSFIYGNKNGQVIQSTLNWMGTRNEKILYNNVNGGAIVKLEIIGDLLILFNDVGISFYSMIQERVVKVIKRGGNEILPAELVWPKTCLIERDRMVVGWCGKIWGFKFDGIMNETNQTIIPKASAFKLGSTISSFNNKPEISIDVEFQFQLDEDSLICGIGSFKDDCLVVLTIDSTQGKLESPPELRIINCITHEEVVTDEVFLKKFERLRVNDLQLGQFIGNTSKYYIICSTDGIIAEEIDLRGRFDWFVSKEKYSEAWDISEHLISEKERVELGIKQVQKILDRDESDQSWEDASVFLSEVLNKLSDNDYLLEKWEQWSWIFIHSRKFHILSAILPTEKVLPEVYYDECLIHFLDHDVVQFLKYLTKWDGLYGYTTISSKAEQFLEINNDVKLRRNLSELYLKHEDYQLAIPHLIILKDLRTIDILSENHLLQQFIDELPTVIKFEISSEELKYGLVDQIQEKSSKLIDILVQNRHEIIPSQFIELMDLNNLEIISFLYLRKLSSIDEFSMINFETEMVSLYAKFEPRDLIRYLKHKQHYDIDKAMEIMSEYGYYKELVYLLSKTGKSREAMVLLIDEMNDAKRAVEFAIDSRNDELWEILFSKGLSKPEFLKTLIENAGEMLDSKTLKRVPSNVHVEGLKELLIKMFTDNSLSLSLQRTVLDIVEIEGVRNSDILNALRVNGRAFTPDDI